MQGLLHNTPTREERVQWEPFRSLAMVSGLLGQVRKKAAKVRISVCREFAGKVPALYLLILFLNSFH